MKYLYKKLYEAINTGILKALILDDKENISMNYQYKKIVNNSNVIFYYVDDLLNKADNEYNYELIIKYYNETGYKYKVKDFIELKNIFDKIKGIENTSFEWIENMKDYISIVLEDKSEINFYEKTDKKSLFLKFANDDIVNTENIILIYLHDDHYVSEKVYKWQTEYAQIQGNEYLIDDENNVEKDYSGYENCLKIQDIVWRNSNKGEIPAIEYCLNLNDINGYQGYLPSMGLLRIMSDNIDLINYIFKYLNLNKIKDLNNANWWSSTEYGNTTSWSLCHGITNYFGIKVSTPFRIFPLFAVKN